VNNEQNARPALYLVFTFGITWIAWWSLAPLVEPGAGVFSNRTFASLYIAGGLGPTLGALISVALTPREGTFADYGASLIRWRAAPAWYLAALLFPPVLAFALELLTGWLGQRRPSFPALADLSRLPLMFPTMIVGGGLEELGWRGVLQPRLEKRLSRLSSAAIVGVCWAMWHVPLFFIHGVAQFDANFPLFALDVVANALFLAWIYGGTRSIIACVLFHAASNTCATMGLGAVDADPEAAWISAAVKLSLGVLLLVALARSEATRARAAPSP
jgi:membrane protease YdiL (CAAX protease family)